jgi:hypothetical protein
MTRHFRTGAGATVAAALLVAASASEAEAETPAECAPHILQEGKVGRTLPADQRNQSGGQLRTLLNRAVKAPRGSAENCKIAMREDAAFVAVLARDSRNSLAVMELVLAQTVIGSQLIDNLNASMHVRALLTNTFVPGEVLRTRRAAAKQTAQTAISAGASLRSDAARGRSTSGRQV